MRRSSRSVGSPRMDSGLAGKSSIMSDADFVVDSDILPC